MPLLEDLNAAGPIGTHALSTDAFFRLHNLEAGEPLSVTAEELDVSAIAAGLGAEGVKLNRSERFPGRRRMRDAVHDAVMTGNLSKVTRVLRAAATLDARDGEGRTPLMLAIYYGHERLTERMLFTFRAPLESTDSRGYTALHTACEEPSLRMVNLVIRAGPVVGARTVDLRTPLHILASRSNGETEEQAELLRFLVNKLLLLGADANARDRAGNTPLHLATRAQNVDTVAALCDCGASVSAPNNAGDTPLHVAAEIGADIAARELLLHGANVHAKSSRGETPLAVAARVGNQSVVDVLSHFEVMSHQGSSWALDTAMADSLPANDDALQSSFAELPSWTASTEDVGEEVRMSLRQLVVEMTAVPAEEFSDRHLTPMLLLHPAYGPSSRFLSCLVTRFLGREWFVQRYSRERGVDAAVMADLPDADDPRQLAVRLNVVRTLHAWVSAYARHFADVVALSPRILSFTRALARANLPDPLRDVLEEVSRVCAAAPLDARLSFAAAISMSSGDVATAVDPTMRADALVRGRRYVSLLADVDSPSMRSLAPEKLAAKLAAVEADLVRSLSWSNLINSAAVTSGLVRADSANNHSHHMRTVSLYLKWLDDTVRLLQGEVVRHRSDKARAAAIKSLVCVADASLALRNYNAAFEVLLALLSPVVASQVGAWKLVVKSKETCEAFWRVVSSLGLRDEGWTEYRALLLENCDAKRGCVPFLPILFARVSELTANNTQDERMMYSAASTADLALDVEKLRLAMAEARVVFDVSHLYPFNLPPDSAADPDVTDAVLRGAVADQSALNDALVDFDSETDLDVESEDRSAVASRLLPLHQALRGSLASHAERGLLDREWRRVFRGELPREYTEGDAVVSQGGAITHFMQVSIGEVRVVHRTDRGDTRTTGYLRPGDLIGINPLLGLPCEFDFTAMAAEPFVRVLAIPIASLVGRLDSDLGLQRRFYYGLARWLADSLRRMPVQSQVIGAAEFRLGQTKSSTPRQRSSSTGSPRSGNLEPESKRKDRKKSRRKSNVQQAHPASSPLVSSSPKQVRAAELDVASRTSTTMLRGTSSSDDLPDGGVSFDQSAEVRVPSSDRRDSEDALFGDTVLLSAPISALRRRGELMIGQHFLHVRVSLYGSTKRARIPYSTVVRVAFAEATGTITVDVSLEEGAEEQMQLRVLRRARETYELVSTQLAVERSSGGGGSGKSFRRSSAIMPSLKAKSRARWNVLLSGATYRRLAPGEAVLVEGSSQGSDSLFQVVEGSVVVRRNIGSEAGADEVEAQVTLATLRKDDVFGEMAYLEEDGAGTSSATVEAGPDGAEVAMLSRRYLDVLFQSHPYLGARFFRYIAKILACKMITTVNAQDEQFASADGAAAAANEVDIPSLLDPHKDYMRRTTAIATVNRIAACCCVIDLGILRVFSRKDSAPAPEQTVTGVLYNENSDHATTYDVYEEALSVSMHRRARSQSSADTSSRGSSSLEASDGASSMDKTASSMDETASSVSSRGAGDSVRRMVRSGSGSLEVSKPVGEVLDSLTQHPGVQLRWVVVLDAARIKLLSTWVLQITAGQDVVELELSKMSKSFRVALIGCLYASTSAFRRYPFQSFAPRRSANAVRLFVDGLEYYDRLEHELHAASQTIFISGWAFTPQIFLRRGKRATLADRLDRVLLAAARRGVRVYIMVWADHPVTKLFSQFTAQEMRDMHENVFFLRHPADKPITFRWTHHQKIVVIDHRVAFIGGLDLCYGRWDDRRHAVADDCHLHTRWPGQDFFNPLLPGAVNFKPEASMVDALDRTRVPRMPWHDIHSSICGPAVADVSRSFVQRWNHHRRDSHEKTSDQVIPILDSRPYVAVAASDEGGNADVQVLRSLSGWSGGLRTERSIHDAYIGAIQNAQKFVYIEQQFFISEAGRSNIQNMISKALLTRIQRALLQRELFRVVVVVPCQPDGDIMSDRGTLHVMKYQLLTISRGEFSMLTQVRRMIDEMQRQYPDDEFYHGLRVVDLLGFFSLRNYGRVGETFVESQVYVHAKLMIVDDRIVITGSANINDRSMLGGRDSEIGVLVEGSERKTVCMNGEDFDVAVLAHDLRVRLWCEHLGIGLDRRQAVEDAVHPHTYRAMWCHYARENTAIFNAAFPGTPSDSISTVKEYLAARACEPNDDVCRKRLPNVRGHLVMYPEQFLSGENFTQLSSFWFNVALNLRELQQVFQ